MNTWPGKLSGVVITEEIDALERLVRAIAAAEEESSTRLSLRVPAMGAVVEAERVAALRSAAQLDGRCRVLDRLRFAEENGYSLILLRGDARCAHKAPVGGKERRMKSTCSKKWRAPAPAASDLLIRAAARSIPFTALGPTIARAQAGDADAREVVILSTVRLATRLAFGRRRALGSIDHEDLIAVALSAAAAKIDEFDPSRATTWSTFIVPWMRSAMNRAQTNAAVVRGSIHTVERFLSDPSRADVTTGPGSHAARWWHAKRKELHEDIAACPAVRPLERAASREDAAEIPSRLALLSVLERRVLVRRFGIGCAPQSVADLADDLHVSRVAVRVIESRALFKLRSGNVGGRS